MEGDLAKAENQTATAAEQNTSTQETKAAEAAALKTGETAAADTQTQTTTRQQRIAPLKGADVEGYHRMLEEAMAPAPEPTQEEQQTDSETAAAQETSAQEQTEGEEHAEETQAAEAETAEDVKIPDRIRLKGLSDKSRGKLAAATLLAKSEGIEIEEAFARINGTAKPAEAQATEQQTTQTQQAARTPEQIRAEIATLKADKKAAATDLDTIKMLEIDDQIEALREEEAAVNQQTVQAKSAAQTKFQSDVEKSKAAAIEAYEDAANDDSEFSLKMIEIADRLEAAGDPAVYAADAPLVIARMAGRELGIAPRAKGAKTASSTVAKTSTSAPVKPQSVPQRAVVPGRSSTTTAAAPASGSARTSQNEPAAPDFAKVRTAWDYEKLVETLATT